MSQGPGPTHRQTEEVVEQIARLAQRDAEVRSAVTGEQPGAGTDVRSGQFEVAASLTGALAATATMDVPAIAMPFELRLGKVGDEVVLELACRFEISRAAVAALLGMNVVVDELGAGRRFGPKGAWMLAMFDQPAILRRSLPRRPLVGAPLTALQKRLQLMLELGNAPPQLGILGFEFRNPLIARVVHDPQSLSKNLIWGKTSCLTVTVA
jgi:hypothetical protein